MGLLTHLLLWPWTAPWAGFEWSMGKVLKVVEDELVDDTSVKTELMELQMLLEIGDIDDDEYVRREARLMERLREVRYWREQFGMGTSGGPVRVAGADRDRAGEEGAAPSVASPGGAVIEFSADDPGPAGGTPGA